MSMYHCSVKNISRGGGKSAVASSAYRSGEKLKDQETGLTHDFTKKGGVVHSEIMLCENAPEEYKDRATLWNEVQKIEKQSNARLSREIEVALPKELNPEQQKAIIQEYVKENFVKNGMCADLAIHDKGDGNPHAHIMLTTRSIKENGEWAPKAKKIYDLDENGERIYQKTDSTGKKIYKNHKEDFNDWNKNEKVEEWRKEWANECNKYLSQEHKIDHRSYERQGVEQIPTIHEGYVARQIEQKGGVSEICEQNREIKGQNKAMQLLTQQLSNLSNLRKEIAEQIKEKGEQIKEKGREINERLAKFRANARGTSGDIGGTGQEHNGIKIDNTDLAIQQLEIKRTEQEIARLDKERAEPKRASKDFKKSIDHKERGFDIGGR